MLKREGILVGRRRIRRLMKKLVLWAAGPKPNTSKPHPEHKIYPYLLRGLLSVSIRTVTVQLPPESQHFPQMLR